MRHIVANRELNCVISPLLATTRMPSAVESSVALSSESVVRASRFASSRPASACSFSNVFCPSSHMTNAVPRRPSADRPWT